jgi:L-2-hydroxyglutarate oxidase LhgO
MDKFDVCIAGAGVVGLAIAYKLSKSARYANSSIVLLERESSFGQITSSRNSEVIHAGIYYATDSLKAKLCVTGKNYFMIICKTLNSPIGN